MKQTEQLAHILIYFFFIGIISFGLYHESEKYDTVFFSHSGVIILVIYRLYKTLAVWQVIDKDTFLEFSSFLGILKKNIDPTKDYLKAEGHIEQDPIGKIERGQYLTLFTTQGKFTFHSGDYKISINCLICYLMLERISKLNINEHYSNIEKSN